MYRILAANQPERRNQRSHPCYTKLATGPNQTWSWDITRLRGPNASFYLYVLLDIFEPLLDRENAALAATLIEETFIEPQVLTLHSDRGAPMTSKCTAQLLADSPAL